MNTAAQVDANGEAENPLMGNALSELQRRFLSNDERPCESVMQQFPQIADDKEAMLELIYTEFVLREERGQATAVDDWVRRFPAWDQDLHQLFEVHNHVSHHDEPAHSRPDGLADRWAMRESSTGSSEQRIGKYQLLELIGRGGGGEVYAPSTSRWAESWR